MMSENKLCWLRVVQAVDLVQRMLTLDPDKRITLEEVWVHPWVARSRCVHRPRHPPPLSDPLPFKFVALLAGVLVRKQKWTRLQ